MKDIKRTDLSFMRAKTMKIGRYQKLDEALYIISSFRQQREKGLHVTGPILCEKAKILFPQLYSDVNNKSFTANSGFI